MRDKAAPHGYYDNEARSVMEGLPMLATISEQREATEFAKQRMELFRGGAFAFPHLTRLFRAELRDPYILVRHDLEYDSISIDRWVPQFGCYFKITQIQERLQFGREYQILEMFKAGDLRKTTPKEVLAKTRGAAERIRNVNQEQAKSIVLEAVDSLSNKQVQQFIDVHRAIHTGETIVAHGSDDKIMERMAAASKTAPPVPTGKAVNPGMHPLMYRRTPR
jgi:hypothetical protein